ncbi:hypothetical protein H6F53_23660 [Trichocoleus sp. FACHB-832]|uniref:hypothetical protein n=1 Tax=Trichocoleus sp. FACHB-832 TaxID=2692875 RepID=UPI0016893096|nr:hypothetical protein [Trichocoleus sp. FACHB-832]MBD1908446.1 hypothetical protein [Trichocoleus sp. FACHB-832]
MNQPIQLILPGLEQFFQSETQLSPSDSSPETAEVNLDIQSDEISVNPEPRTQSAS